MTKLIQILENEYYIQRSGKAFIEYNLVKDNKSVEK